MDKLDQVRNFAPRDAADRVNINNARNTLHREIAKTARGGDAFWKRRRVAVGATAGGIFAAGGVAAVVASLAIGGTVVGGSVVAGGVLAPPATAAEVLNQAADTVQADGIDITATAAELQPGQYLKTQSYSESLEFVSPGAAAWDNGFTPVRTGAVASVVYRSTFSSYAPQDADGSWYYSSGNFLPVRTYGDAAVVEQTWNAGYVPQGYAPFAEALASQENPHTVNLGSTRLRDCAVVTDGSGTLTGTDGAAIPLPVYTKPVPADADAFLVGEAINYDSGLALNNDPTSSDGEISMLPQTQTWVSCLEQALADPTKTLAEADRVRITDNLAHYSDLLAERQGLYDAKAAALMAGSAAELAASKQRAIDGLLVAIMQPEFAANSPEYRAFVLRAIASSPDITIASHEGDTAVLTFTAPDHRVNITVNTATGQVTQLDRFDVRTMMGDTSVEIGTTDLIPADVPDERIVLTTEVVDSAPTVTD